jgi:hypothetical protein
VAAHATAIGGVRWTATVPATMDGTEVVASAATVTLPIGVGLAGTMIVVVGMQRQALTD